MSEAIEIKGMEAGDRIRATHENGDVVEFTVQFTTTPGSYVYATSLLYFTADGDWSFEKITPPLPTEPGFYRDRYDALWFQEIVGGWALINGGGICTGYGNAYAAERGPFRPVEVSA